MKKTARVSVFKRMSDRYFLRFWTLAKKSLSFYFHHLAVTLILGISMGYLTYHYRYDLTIRPTTFYWLVFTVLLFFLDISVNSFIILYYSRPEKNLLKALGKTGLIFLSKLFYALVTSIILGLLYIFGFIAFIFPVFIMIIVFSQTIYAVLLENANPISALRYSVDMTKGNRIFIAFVFIINSILYVIVQSLVGTIPVSIRPIITSVFPGTFMWVVYYLLWKELKSRKANRPSTAVSN